MKRSIVCMLAVLLTVYPTKLVAEESFEDLLKQAQTLKEQGKYGKAITELGWASKQLETLHLKKVSGFLPAQAGEFKGGEAEVSSAIGMLSIEKRYTAPSGAVVKLSLAGAAAADGGGGLGGLAGMAQMAAMMGNVPGIETVRIKGQRATIQTESGEPKLMLSIAGFMIQLEPEDGAVKKEHLIALAEGIDIQGLTAYAGS